MNIITQHTVGAAVVTALCAFGPAVAGAQQQSTSTELTRSTKVSLAGLDLSTPEGARTAHERLYKVARTLCSQVADDLDLSRHTNYLACVDDAMARSLPTIQQLARKNSPVRGFASTTGK